MTGTDRKVAEVVAAVIGIVGVALLFYAGVVFLGVPFELIFLDESERTISVWVSWSGMLAIIIGQLFIWTATKLSPHG